MPQNIIMPQLGESIAEGTIVKWLKKVGETVKKDENILVISTDKVEAEIPAPATGLLIAIGVKEGTTVAVGTVLGQVGEAGADVGAQRAAPVQSAPPAAPVQSAPPAAPVQSAPPAAPVAAPVRAVHESPLPPAGSYDLVIIGSGPGGYVAAARAGYLGLKVAVVEKDKLLGGTCLHRGCIPTKALLHAADLITEVKEGARMGVSIEGVKVDWAALMKHKGQILTSNAGGVAHLMKSRKVDVISGFGRLNGARQVIVKDADGKETKLDTKNILVAVGSKPRALPFAPFDGDRVMSSDHILDIPNIPGSLCIIGGGVIGIEFASLFARLGTKVTVLEALPKILGPADADCTKELSNELSKQGCDIKLNVKVTAVEVRGQTVKTTIQNPDGTTGVVETERLLVAIGRPALTENIGLETTKAKLDRGFIGVSPYMESDEPGVFAIGDCVNTPWLAHIASAEGNIAVETIAHRMGKGPLPAPLNYDHTPSCVYSDPPVAWSGITEEEAKKRGIDYKVSKADFAKNAKAAILLKKRGFVKFITDAKYGEILGVHIVGPQATELLAEPAFAMAMETTVQDIAATVHAHPTLYETIYEAAAIAAGRPAHG